MSADAVQPIAHDVVGRLVIGNANHPAKPAVWAELSDQNHNRPGAVARVRCDGVLALDVERMPKS